MVEAVGSLQLAARGLKEALQNSGLEAALETVNTARRAGEDEAAKDPRAAESRDEGGKPKSLPGHGLGRHVDITA